MTILTWFLLIVIISCLLFLYIIPFLVRYYLKRLSGKLEKKARQESGAGKKDGSINIDYISKSHKDKEAPGDYVDFEEIDDK